VALQSGQPKIRFGDTHNPSDSAGVCYVPKVISLTKTVTAAANVDFWTAPANTFIQQACVFVVEALDGTTPAATLGTDGTADALVNATDLSVETAGNWATNIGSATAAAAAGLFLPAGDTLRLAITGTDVTEGKLSVLLFAYNVGEITEDPHFNL